MSLKCPVQEYGDRGISEVHWGVLGKTSCFTLHWRLSFCLYAHVFLILLHIDDQNNQNKIKTKPQKTKTNKNPQTKNNQPTNPPPKSTIKTAPVNDKTENKTNNKQKVKPSEAKQNKNPTATETNTKLTCCSEWLTCCSLGLRSYPVVLVTWLLMGSTWHVATPSLLRSKVASRNQSRNRTDFLRSAEADLGPVTGTHAVFLHYWKPVGYLEHTWEFPPVQRFSEEKDLGP